MKQSCKPCRERTGKIVPATHVISGEPMCEHCFHGGNERAIAECLKDRIHVGAGLQAARKEGPMSERLCDTCSKPMHGRTKGTTCRKCRNGAETAGGGRRGKRTARRVAGANSNGAPTLTATPELCLAIFQSLSLEKQAALLNRLPEV